MTVTIRLSATFLCAALIFVSSALTNGLDLKPVIELISEEDLAKVLAPYMANEEYIRQIHLMINAQKGEMLASRTEIETNDFISSKTGKRNVDLINSILALPKGMNDAGR